jgi:hypothetical protein
MTHSFPASERSERRSPPQHLCSAEEQKTLSIFYIYRRAEAGTEKVGSGATQTGTS